MRSLFFATRIFSQSVNSCLFDVCFNTLEYFHKSCSVGSKGQAVAPWVRLVQLFRKLFCHSFCEKTLSWSYKFFMLLFHWNILPFAIYKSENYTWKRFSYQFYLLGQDLRLNCELIRSQAKWFWHSLRSLSIRREWLFVNTQ
jgi:hypothetical protein